MSSSLVRGAGEQVEVPAPGTSDLARPPAGAAMSKKGRKGKKGKAGYLFLTPWIIGCVCLTLGPIIASLYFSFTDYSLLASPHWVGLKNYSDMFHDKRYWASVIVTVKYVFIGVPIKLGIALLIALLLKDGMRHMSVYRAIYYVPSLLGGSVAIAILWRQIFGDPGIFQSFLALFGIESQGWLTSPATSLNTLIVLEAWQFGSPMLIFLAGLRQMPQDLYDSAAVDGAGPVRKFWNVTLPLLTPILFFNLVLQMIGSFQAFTPSFIISSGTGGPVDSTLFYTLYLYIQGFGNLQMGYASAMAWVLLVVVGAITGLLFFTAKYWVFYGDSR
ncbi:carbohydrate ABC transporter permease [Kribbella sp. NPDC049227]|uniref:carbohydrate ABC transporter permease n=1 Tax=Kribbella sp. NPDC049227 TaxID=3364113 RepID=UPI0037193918